MSQDLLIFVKNYLTEGGDPGEFVDNYAGRWKKERDNGLGGQDNETLSEVLSTIFCLADLFNPEEDREDYEIDEAELRKKMEEVLSEARFL
ncbi:colicin immunity domain-containing protein [Andreprevotia chitinilytica]|uniref:colicin immunity domain-containing protein n=1 Tax=Andreprevotia chitinilytica TaxID=396808 RepID=UPI0005521F7D|nr:colicin immunity domain-containing protein [Andreprevotia chitinilytica]